MTLHLLTLLFRLCNMPLILFEPLVEFHEFSIAVLVSMRRLSPNLSLLWKGGSLSRHNAQVLATAGHDCTSIDVIWQIRVISIVFKLIVRVFVKNLGLHLCLGATLILYLRSWIVLKLGYSA